MAGRHRSAAPSAGPPLLPIMAAAAVVVVILLAGVVVRLVGGDGNGDADAAPADRASAAGSPTSAASRSGTTPSPSPSVTASGSPSPTATSASPSPTAKPSKKPRDAPTLTLEVTRSISYIEVRGPNGQVYVLDTFDAGFKRSWDDPRLTVVLGNSAAVKVTVNGTVRPRGGEGQVQRFTVTRD